MRFATRIDVQERNPLMRLKRLAHLLALTGCTAVLLAGCGKLGDNGKIEAVIDAGLAQNGVCERLPVDIAARQEEIARHTFALKRLQDKGLIEPGTLQAQDLLGHAVPVPGFVTTQAGKSLIQQPGVAGFMYMPPCVRMGQYKVKSIEAVDDGVDFAGHKVTNVRARRGFEPQPWFADTRSAAEAASVWKAAEETEKGQWMYRLTKSGSDYFFGGMGTRLSGS
jgi:hypothetical protein